MDIKEIALNKKLHIFDMDGTLVNLEELNRLSYSSTINRYFNITLSDNDYQNYFSGTKTAKAFDSYLQSKNLKNYIIDELIKDFRKRKEDFLENNFNSYVSLIPNADEYLKHLKSDGKIIVLATSTIKFFTEVILKKLGFLEYFDFVVTAEDVLNGKPNPEIYNFVVSKAGIQKEFSVVYEDSRNGIISAKSAELFCIGIHSQGLNDIAVKTADHIIKDYLELI